MSVFKTQEVLDAVSSKWDSLDFVDVIHQGFGRNAPINKFIICYDGNYFAVDVESWFYDDDSGDVVDFEDIEDDFVEVKRVEKVVTAWEEK
ncbi:MAG: hypothetical protein KBT03_13125 [Bacteroidales bacterium]|nr:hypothetical protein [Candidatus Scybalousia scybalohippi]